MGNGREMQRFHGQMAGEMLDSKKFIRKSVTIFMKMGLLDPSII